jgi:alanyl-tRNA synthetase
LVEQGRTQFLGYEDLAATSRVQGLLVEREMRDEIGPDMEAELVLDRTPFYAETGGQVGDRGSLFALNGDKAADVLTAYPAVPGLTVHRIVTTAPIRVGDELRAEVARPLRLSTMRNHTATHLLHAALRQVLGTHVKQAGSVVEPPRLRFDFTHYAAMDKAEIEEVERLVNDQILRNSGVETKVLPLEQAVATGAMALFGEKYGDQVRVVSVPDFSKELCGGTHVRRTGDIGVFKIVQEGSISAGVRRIEAVTGEGAVRQYQDLTGALHRLSELLKTSEPELVEHVEKMIAREKILEHEKRDLRSKLAHAAAGGLESQARTVNGSHVLAVQADALDRQQMRELVDALRNKWKSAVVVLASVEDSTVSIVSAVTKDLTAKVHAGKLAAALAQAVGGKGGGRPDMAEGGGKDPAALPAALARIYAEIESQL